MARWVRTTIKEPFPMFYSHHNQKCRLANNPATEGPFYVANSEWFDMPDKFEHRQRCANGLRKDGYTVTVELVER